MTVMDVLLGLNFVVLAAFAVRRQAKWVRPMTPVKSAKSSQSRPVSCLSDDAVILPFASRASASRIHRAMALHPSAKGGASQFDRPHGSFHDSTTASHRSASH